MDRPNLLLIVLDTVRRDRLSCYGHDRETTPTLDAFADRATRYEQAVAAAPWTAPSHASMFTGQYPTRHRVFGSQPQLDEGLPVVADRLRAAGYTTMGFSNSFFTGVEHGYSRGFDTYHDLPSLPRPKWAGGHMFEATPEYARFLARYFLTDDDVSYFQTAKARSELGRADDPFFCFLNLRSAHNPYTPPPRYREPYEEQFTRWDEVDEETAHSVASGDGGERYMVGDLDVGEADWDLVGHWYDAELRYMDDLLAGLFDQLKRDDIFEDTLVVVTSDHGEHLGEHGLLGHNFSLSEILVNVPLLVKWPDQTEERVSDELVSLADLAPTFADVAGTSMGVETQGRSLVSDPEPEVVFSEYEGCYLPWRRRLGEQYARQFPRFDSRFQAARTKTHKLVVDKHGEETLYGVGGGDFEEVAVDDEAVASDLRGHIDATLGTFPDVDGVPGSEELSSHVRGHLQELGYL
ncbi:sulfatase [Halomarina litorea]|uniref:sulfatase n=1 Tax=Halomarina litorea TaxID=2961595 RepID=UPI0020C27926|nr:sulfatase [Halomarina sp. BCD28]